MASGTHTHRAGEITARAREVLGRPIPPWDSLEALHLVAGCAYSTGRQDADAPLIRCPGPDIVVPDRQLYLVDAEGRSSRDEVDQMVMDHIPCPRHTR